MILGAICCFTQFLQGFWKCLLSSLSNYIPLRISTERRNVDERFTAYASEELLLYSDTPQSAASLITSKTQVDEIMDCLVQHNCRDITADIDPSINNIRIARGGFGIVYSGRLLDGRLVAVKCLEVLTSQSWMGNSNLKHTARELYAWSKCDHPGVLPLLGMARFRDGIAMVSPLMSNERLDHYIAENPLVNRIGLATQIAGALAYLHEKGITHGDVKAANILVSEEGLPKLADFGNAVVSPCTLTMTPTEPYGCTIRWAAPEVLDIGSRRQTTHADVYALGMTLLEIFTGQIPYAEKNDMAVWGAVVIRKEIPPRPQFYQLFRDNRLDDEVWKLLVDCWAYEPNTRPTAHQVKNELVKMDQDINGRAAPGMLDC